MGTVSRDVTDIEIIDAVELASDGSSSYKSGITVSQTISGTSRVIIAPTGPLFLDGLVFGDDPVEAGDKVVLAGTTAADGMYTVNSIIDNSILDVVESILDSIGGTAAFRHPAGSKRIGVDPTSISASSQTNLQGVLEDLDASISSGGITAAQHKALRDLIHFIDNGPGDGFSSGAYRETVGGIFPTSIVWYEDVTKAKKLVEKTIGGSAVAPSPITWKMYDTDGSTVLITLVDMITYMGIVETSRTRTWS